MSTKLGTQQTNAGDMQTKDRINFKRSKSFPFRGENHIEKNRKIHVHVQCRY